MKIYNNINIRLIKLLTWFSACRPLGPAMARSRKETLPLGYGGGLPSSLLKLGRLGRLDKLGNLSPNPRLVGIDIILGMDAL